MKQHNYLLLSSSSMLLEREIAKIIKEKGFIDAIIDRRDLRRKLYRILSMHEVEENKWAEIW